MKDYTVYLSIGASFDTRTEAYDLLEDFRNFLDESIQPENFELQDVKLGYRNYYENPKNK